MGLISKQQARQAKANNKSATQSLSSKTQRSKAEAREQLSNAPSLLKPSTEKTATEKATTTHHDIDLIFMDIQMPRMSGREATEQIRKIEAADSHIPIIALTAHGLSDERDRLIASGIDDYVGKPISQPQLLQVLQKWLGRAATKHMATSTQLAHTNIADSSLADLSANNANDTQLKVSDQDNNEGKQTQLH